ncbi:hypothetical protein NLG97_g7266 [Lecanicillium saksenae]|uniref:Uncharacterized protein n=1 Tax=Lecanicillium saksenae TaxID=468837 RepID=A0ACC1QQA1_9HYPO|nr:hypothetical protein NLG97_g7266 [Lecanicillium saksenae]
MARKSTHQPHPGTLVHLIPQTPAARKALQHQENRKYVSHTEDGREGLEIGYHVSRHSSANTITSLGHQATLYVGDEKVSRVGKGRPVVEVANLRQAIHPPNGRRNRAVYRTVDKDNCQRIAVKEFCFVSGGSESWDEACNEYNIHASLQHYNIIPLLGQGRDETSMQIYMLHADGSLQDLAALGKVTEAVSMHCVQDILGALNYLYEQGEICHRDVKPANFLYTLTGDKKRPFKFYLADFRLATRDPPPGCVGTDGFIAPEVRRGDVYGCKADVWSLATAIQCAYGRRFVRLDIMTREDAAMRAEAGQALRMLFSGEGLTTAPENIPILHDPPPSTQPRLPRELERLRIDMNR